MREIKFRAWDTEKQEITEPGNPYVSQFQAIDIASKFVELRYLDGSEKHPYIFLQYTGLKDKNGKMIFEGDIVKYPNDTIPCIVKYIGSSFVTDDMSNSKNRLGDILPVCEVIGNIYENPKLIS